MPNPTDTDILNWIQDRDCILNQPGTITGPNNCHVYVPITRTDGRHYYGRDYRHAVKVAMAGEAEILKP